MSSPRRAPIRRKAGAGADAEAVEGVMLKRRDAAYVPGRPKGLWWKWKRDPLIVDAVLMYAQRGHGKRSSYYSDYTFGVWTKGESGDELVPVGKAYFGFTDEELHEIDRFVRNNTIERFGPVREVTHEADKGLVFEVAFEGLQRSTRHKSGARHALSPHQPAALGQAAARGRPAGNAGEDAGENRERPRRHAIAAPNQPWRARADDSTMIVLDSSRFGRFAWLTTSTASSADRRSRCSASSSCCRS